MGSNLLDTRSYTKTYSVHTGTDIFSVFNDSIISTIQGISYSITRQKAPIYTMGSPDPRAIARSKRGIAGSMIMTTFDRHCLGDFMAGSSFAAKRGSIETSTGNPYVAPVTTTPALTETVQTVSPADIGTLATVPSTIAETPGSLSISAPPMFADQLLPFDSTLAAANEYGQGSMMRVFAIEVLNEGAGISIDDTSNEVQMTYIARLVTPWIEQQTLQEAIG